MKDVVNTSDYLRGIGTHTINTAHNPNLDFFTEKAAYIKSPDIANILSFAMHNNSPNSLGGNIYSAYFTLYWSKVIIEWGKENDKGELKLHTFLNEHINLNQRDKHARFFRSGHYGQITLPGDSEQTTVVLLDCSLDQVINKSNPLYDLVATMAHNKILPVNSLGFPIKIN